MYDRLITHNPCLRGCDLISFDNNDTNEFISKRYNSFIDAGEFNEGDWLVFCHEDFEFLEPLMDKLVQLEVRRDVIYGIAGPSFDNHPQGCTLNSEKDGSEIAVSGYPFKRPKLAATLDCMCLIVSAQLIKKSGMRFDENFHFDLYCEDFCIQAKESFGIDSYVLPIRSQHYSWGVVGDRFIMQYKYICQKYRDVRRTYYTTLSRRVGGGCCDVEKYEPPIRRHYILHFFLKRMTASGYIVWSIFRYKICFLWIRVVDPFQWKKANPSTIYPPKNRCLRRRNEH